MQKKCLYRSAISAVFAVSCLCPQSSGTPPSPPTPAQIVQAKVARLSTILNLTNAQQSQATTIFTTAQTTISGLGGSLQDARTALQTAVLANDSAGIAAQSTQIGSLIGQVTEAEANANAAFYAILTTDQQTKYKTILSQDPHLLSSGPGGPGAPGGHPGSH